jgi:lipopolysaccharide biosynthesis regulator YciM
MEQYDSARSNLRRALAIDDWCVYSHLELGRILAREHSYDSAEQEFRAVVAYAPDYIEGYSDLSDILTAAGRPAESESILVACASRFPVAADPVLRLARLRLLSGNAESAVRGLSGFLALCPDNRDARSLLDSIVGRRRNDTGPGN